LGLGVRHALFPDRTRLGALAFAGCVLPDATLRGMRMFRSHGGTVLTVAGRDLLSEASAPGSVAPCRERHAGRGADTSAMSVSHVHTVATGTAPAFGRPLAPRYGSDLLTLRLLSLLQRGDVVLHAAPLEEFTGLCLGPFAPRRRDSVACPARAASGAFWRGRPAGNRAGVLVCAVATKTLWGNCVGARVETSRGPDSARARFLITPCRSVPSS
jgi:hypothetical protein